MSENSFYGTFYPPLDWPWRPRDGFQNLSCIHLLVLYFLFSLTQWHWLDSLFAIRIRSFSFNRERRSGAIQSPRPAILPSRLSSFPTSYFSWNANQAFVPIKKDYRATRTSLASALIRCLVSQLIDSGTYFSRQSRKMKASRESRTLEPRNGLTNERERATGEILN